MNNTSTPADLEPDAGGPTDIPHTMTRRTIAKRLTEAKQQVPHFYLKVTCCIDPLLALRRQLNEGASTKVSVNDLMVRAAALALREVPDANVSWGDDAVRRHKGVDVSVAVAAPRGLVTPIVRGADAKPAAAIAAELKELVGRARAGRLNKEEYQGGNISVSNLGMYGVEEFSGIINPPQSCVLAVGAGLERAIVREGKVCVATMMSITASVDHRAVDGAVAAQMLAALKRLIEDPAALAG